MSYYATASIQTRFQERILLKQNQCKMRIISLLICAIVLFSILYIIQVNGIATLGYKIREFRSEVLKLQSENKDIELRLSQVQSPGFLEEKIKNLNMVKTARVEYILPTSQVAAR